MFEGSAEKVFEIIGMLCRVFRVVKQAPALARAHVQEIDKANFFHARSGDCPHFGKKVENMIFQRKAPFVHGHADSRRSKSFGARVNVFPGRLQKGMHQRLIPLKVNMNLTQMQMLFQTGQAKSIEK